MDGLWLVLENAFYIDNKFSHKDNICKLLNKSKMLHEQSQCL